MPACPRCSASCDPTHGFCYACGAELTGPAPTAEDTLLGRTLPGGYRVTHLIGVGGMGRVYCAEQVALGRTVAVKVVHPHLADDDQAAGRFLTEARAASRLGHPNSVAILDFGRTHDGQAYLVMEYLRGRDLARVNQAEGPLPPARIVDVLRQALSALEEAHALGIVHRDIKPDNIVLEPLRSGHDFVKVVDFGLAKLLEGGPASAGGALTRPGLVCGTPEYMSPEQGRGDPLDGRADLYSLGVVLFELLTGRVPFCGDGPTKTLLMHLYDAVPDPRAVAPERAIPPALAAVAMRALAKAREDRFQDAPAFSDALERTLADAGGGIRREPILDARKRCRACGSTSPLGQRFCGDCGAQIATSSAPAPSRSPPPARSGTLPLLARDAALEWLEARRREASVIATTAHIVGEPGVGKTRLLGELLERCAASGDRVVAVGPDPTSAEIGDAALREAVRALAGLPTPTTSDADWGDAGEQARTGLRVLFGGPAGSLTAGERRQALAEALRWSLENASRRAGPAFVVLAVDDLDFVDGTSRSAFADVLAQPPAVGALLVVTYSAGARPAGEPLAEEVWSLEPLPTDCFASLLPARLAADHRALVPLHLEQLVAWARETSEPAPERLVDVIARRAERLPADARHVLHALAVWGDDATTASLAATVPAGVDVPAALEELHRAGFVAREGPTIGMAHPLMRMVVFSGVPVGLKRELFARAAALRPDAPLEIRARQAMHGGSAFEALSLLDALAARRAAHGDLVGSVRALRDALDVARRELHGDELDDPIAVTLVFSRKLAEALAAANEWTDAEGVLREALGSAPPTSEHRARLLGVLARVANARRRTSEARQYLAEAKRVARQSDAREILPMLETLEKAIA